MSILHRLSRDEIHSGFTHYGWFVGLVPVYVGQLDGDCPDLVERNWVPEWEPAFPIALSGKIEP